MKKILLLIGMSSFAILASAQTVFNVDAPASIAGGYEMNFATTSSWGVADLTLPASSVVDTIVFVADATVGDSLGCNALTNGVDVAGKIAVVYRGECDFGKKAKNAENAGAVGVIVINNIPGPPVGMAGGTFGANVTVPTVMVSDITGAMLANAVLTDDVIVFIGNKIGRFANDLSFYQKDVRRPIAYANIQTLSQDASEFSTEMGSWVFNYGVNVQYNISLEAVVTFGGVTKYSNTISTDSIVPGDSLYMALPDYSQSTYGIGYYGIAYNVTSDSTDNSISDNQVKTGFVMNENQISYGIIDSVTYKPVGESYYRPTGAASFGMCMNYRNDNASRVGVRGLTFSATTFNSNDATVNLVDEYIQIEAFKWEDNFTEISNATVSDLNSITTGDYDYSQDLQGENVYVDFNESFALEDGQRYLFCVTTESENVYLGYSSSLDYFANQDTLDQPISIVNSDGTLNLRGFGTDQTPAMAFETIDVAEVGIEESKDVKVTAYPNPAKDFISIPVGDKKVESVKIYDVAGKLVSSQKMSLASNVISLDVSKITNGTYIVALNFVDNTTSNINVVISK